MKCRICNKNALQIGGYLTRVNRKGVPGVWECRPTCDAALPSDTKLLMAIDGSEAPKEPTPRSQPQGPDNI